MMPEIIVVSAILALLVLVPSAVAAQPATSPVAEDVVEPVSTMKFETSTPGGDRLEALQTEMRALQKQILREQNELDTLRQNNPVALRPDTQSDDSAMIHALSHDYTRLRDQLSLLESTYGDNAPNVLESKRELETMHQRLSVAQNYIVEDQNVVAQYRNGQNDLQQLNDAAKLLAERINHIEEQHDLEQENERNVLPYRSHSQRLDLVGWGITIASFLLTVTMIRFPSSRANFSGLILLVMLGQLLFAAAMFLLGRSESFATVAPLFAGAIAWLVPLLAQRLVSRRIHRQELRKMLTIDAA